MLTQRLNTLRRLLNDETGASTITTAIFMMMGLAIVATTIFTPYLLAQGNRRSVQTGADAAALAGAGVYADKLSVYWPLTGPAIGFCGEPFESLRQRTLMQYYSNYYRPGLNTFAQMAYMEAADFGAKNKTRISQYNYYFEGSWPDYIGDIGIGPLLEPIVVSLETERTLNLNDGSSFDVPAGAAAVAYFYDLKEWKWMIPCENPQMPPKPVMYWKFSWLRSLVDPR